MESPIALTMSLCHAKIWEQYTMAKLTLNLNLISSSKSLFKLKKYMVPHSRILVKHKETFTKVISNWHSLIYIPSCSLNFLLFEMWHSLLFENTQYLGNIYSFCNFVPPLLFYVALPSKKQKTFE